jgi:hypothetical protein
LLKSYYFHSLSLLSHFLFVAFVIPLNVWLCLLWLIYVSLLISFVKKQNNIRFIEHYDRNREALLDVYSSQAFFSLSLPFLKSHPNQKSEVKYFAPECWKHNRNLLGHKLDESMSLSQILNNSFLHRVNQSIQSIHWLADWGISLVQIMERLICGRVDIVHTIRYLPSTEHKLDSFVYDAFLLPSKIPVRFSLNQIHVSNHIKRDRLSVSLSLSVSLCLSLPLMIHLYLKMRDIDIFFCLTLIIRLFQLCTVVTAPLY